MTMTMPMQWTNNRMSDHVGAVIIKVIFIRLLLVMVTAAIIFLVIRTEVMLILTVTALFAAIDSSLTVFSILVFKYPNPKCCNRYREYGVKVDWEYGSTSTYEFQIQFNLHMPSSQYDPKLIDSQYDPKFYTCHSQLLTLHGDEIPRMWRSKYAFRRRIKELLKSMPLVGVKRVIENKKYDIDDKIIGEIVRKLRTSLFGVGISKGFFINVTVTEHLCTPSSSAAEATVTESEYLLLKEVRLDTLCSICLEHFDKYATCLPCSHIFHGHCLVRWLEKDQKHKCPLCREPVSRDKNYTTYCDSTTGYKHSYCFKVERKVRALRNINTLSHVYFEPAKKRVCNHEASRDLHIQFNLYKSKGVGCVGHYGEVERYDGVEKIQLGSESQLLAIPNDHREQLQPAMITQVLKSMGVPLYERPPIVVKIFEVVANNSFDDCYAFINVDIYEETLSLVDLSMGMNAAPNRWRATKVAIEELERVKLNKSCGICKDDFSDGLLASRFPCLQHIFHRDCILSRLKTDHKCPLCRYPMPKS